MKRMLGLMMLAAVAATFWWAAPFARAQTAQHTDNVIAVDADPATGGVQSSVSVAVGSTFTIDIVLADISEPYSAYQAKVRFDPAVVKYVSGPVQHTLGAATLCADGVENPDNLYTGCVRVSGTQSDAGPAFSWTLTCLADGTSGLHLLSSAEVELATGSNMAIGEDGIVSDGPLHDASVTCGSGGPEKTLVATPANTPTPYATVQGQQQTAIAGARTSLAEGTPEPALTPDATQVVQRQTEVVQLKTEVVQAKTPGSPAQKTATARSGISVPNTGPGPASTSTAQALAREGDTSSDGGGGSNTGLIAGIIAAVVVVVAAAGGGALYLRRRRASSP